MNKKSISANLSKAKKVKKDDFYTQLDTIENELRHYKEHFKDKIVYCNCDDPRSSNFFHYFSYNFEKLGLKKLITTCYKNNQLEIFSQHNSERAIKIEYKGDKNSNNVPDIEEIGVTHLEGDGDFRSNECIEILKEADIVVTNPPFSLFREYIQQLIDYNKQFLIIGNLNAITYKEVFKLIQKNKVWLGVSLDGRNVWFEIPDHYEKYHKIENERKYAFVAGAIWYTNLKHKKRTEELILYKKFNSEEYPKYDNYDAINVDKVVTIPIDFDGVMGVPITFLNKHNPNQFKILGITSGRDEFEARPTKRYINAIQINPNGTKVSGSKANTRATLCSSNKPSGVYYIADNADGYLSILYARILIKRK
jgi:hypothetical protein